jgi:hypothetical protein
MRLVGAIVAVLALSTASASATTDIYKPEKYVARHCNAMRNICSGIFESGGIVFQLMTSDRYFSRYLLCVRPPRGGARKCRTASINRQGSVYGSNVRWPRRFGDYGPGVYRVSWSRDGRQLGPTLAFKRY